MSQVIEKNLVEFSLVNVIDDELVEEGKVMVTSGIHIKDDGSLTIEGMVRIV